MENILDILLALLIFTLLIVILYAAFNFKTKSEKEYEKKLKESLADEFIIDPETGAKLTLEEAESGHWVAHDNEFRTISESELKKLPTEDEKQVEIALNYLRESKVYTKTKFTPKQLKKIEKTKVLNSYDDWSYSNPYKFEKGFAFLPAPELRGTTYYQNDYCESHLMFWVKITNIDGHYFFREKSSSEKFLDKLRDDDDIKFNDYECFTFKKSHSIILLKNILECFGNERNLEIEIHNKNLFIKTTKLLSLEDIKRIENIISKL